MSAAGRSVRAFHLETANGPRFCLHHGVGSGQPVRGALLYVHPFAEETNKSRRMASVSARQFAALGFEVLQLDLLGCGDSPGEFGLATWDDWVADVRAGLHWLRRSSGHPPGLWGLRAGCLVGLDAALAEEAQAGPGTAPRQFLFWQPPASGKVLAQQFLRLRVAADALRQPAAVDTSTATDEPDASGTIEVAGYRLHPQLLGGFRQSQMRPPGFDTQSAWLEVTSRQPAQLLPATERAAALWREGGHQVQAQAVDGPGFWQTHEILVVPALLQASIDWLRSL